MIDLWDQLSFTELKARDAYINRGEHQRLIYFLIALYNDFKGLKGSILYRSPLLFVNFIVNELLAKEIRLQSYFEKKILMY